MNELGVVVLNYILFKNNNKRGFFYYYEGQEVRHVGITYSKLIYTDSLQLDLFSEPQKQIDEENLDKNIVLRRLYTLLPCQKGLGVLLEAHWLMA